MKLTRTNASAAVAAVCVLWGVFNSAQGMVVFSGDGAVSAPSPTDWAKMLGPFLGAILAGATALWPNNNKLKKGKVLVDTMQAFMSDKEPVKAYVKVDYVDGSVQEMNYDFHEAPLSPLPTYPQIATLGEGPKTTK